MKSFKEFSKYKWGDNVKEKMSVDMFSFQSAPIVYKDNIAYNEILMAVDELHNNNIEYVDWFRKSKGNLKKYKGILPEILEWFINSSPNLQKILIDFQKEHGTQVYSKISKMLIPILKKQFSHIGHIQSSYPFNIEVNQDKLPNDIIGGSDYDYSFHAGEGKTESQLLAIGSSTQDVKKKLQSVLSKLNIIYTGSAEETRFRQRDLVRSGD